MHRAQLKRSLNSNTLMGLVSAALLVACGSGVISYRNVDTSAGTAQSYGTPKHAAFSMLADTDKEILRLSLFVESECDIIKLKAIDRVRQTLKDGEVVHSDPPVRIQVVRGISGTTPCEHTYARDVQVSLKVGDAVFRLGRTSAQGELNVNLATALQPGMYQDDARLISAEVLVDSEQSGTLSRSSAGTLSLVELGKHEARVSELVKQLEDLLGNTALNEPTNLMRAYRLYEQLHQLDSGDPRIAAVQARFIELFFERRSQQVAAAVKRNLKVLAEAKDLLKGASFSIPPFVQASLYDDTPAVMALQWALGEAITGARNTPAVCESEFSWQQAASAAPQTRFVLTYLRYAFGDGFAEDMTTMCQRSGRF